MKKVELHHAYFWNCDDCGAENFCRSMVAELSAEDKEDAAAHGMPPEAMVTGEWVTRPDEVTCSACGKTFEASDPFNEDEE